MICCATYTDSVLIKGIVRLGKVEVVLAMSHPDITLCMPQAGEEGGDLYHWLATLICELALYLI
jgi:hypothetical protein